MSFPRLARFRAERLQSLGQRLLHFWIVWTALLFVHEGGHALAALHQGHAVQRLGVGLGPELWHATLRDVDVVIRLVPLAGMTTLESAGAGAVPEGVSWLGHSAILSAGIVATLLFALLTGAVVALRERRSGVRSFWLRAVVADAIVLSAFNLLPVPPLDGGRAALDAMAAMRGAPLAGDALFWVQAGGLALAVIPMTIWTRWTARIDRFAMRWRAPGDRARATTAAVARDAAPPQADGRSPRIAA